MLLLWLACFWALNILLLSRIHDGINLPKNSWTTSHKIAPNHILHKVSAAFLCMKLICHRNMLTGKLIAEEVNFSLRTATHNSSFSDVWSCSGAAFPYLLSFLWAWIIFHVYTFINSLVMLTAILNVCVFWLLPIVMTGKGLRKTRQDQILKFLKTESSQR